MVQQWEQAAEIKIKYVDCRTQNEQKSIHTTIIHNVYSKGAHKTKMNEPKIKKKKKKKKRYID